MRNGRFTLLAFVVVAAATSGVVACATRSAPAPTPGPTAASDRVGQFVWQDLMTDEAAKSVAFYEQLLGWTFERTTRLGKPYLVARAGASPVAGIAQVERRQPDEPIAQWLSYLSVADVDAVAARVPGSGGRVLVAPTDVGASRAAIAVDPHGAAFGLVKLGPNVTLPIGGASAPVGTFLLARLPRAGCRQGAHVLRRPRRPRSGPADATRLAPALTSSRAPGRSPVAGIVPIGERKIAPHWLTYVRVTDPTAMATRAEQLGGRILLRAQPDIRNGSVAVVANPGGAAVALQKWPL